MLTPPGGLTCGSGDTEKYYYITLNAVGNKQIRVDILTGYQGTMSFKVEQMEQALFKSSSFKNKDPNISNHYTIMDIKDINNLRVRGAPFILLDGSNTELFKCTLNLLNPNYSEIDNLNLDISKHAAAIHPLKPSNKIDRRLIISLIVIFLVTLAAILYINRKKDTMKEEERKNLIVDLQEINNRTPA